MRKNRRIILGALGLCVCYVVISSAAYVSRGREVLPFFTWDLFAHVPPRVETSYGIRITTVDGRTLATPEYFEKAADLFAKSGSVEAFSLLQRLGKAVEEHRLADADGMRTTFQNVYLGDTHAVSYQLVKRTFDLRQRIKCGCYQAEQVLGEYRSKS